MPLTTAHAAHCDAGQRPIHAKRGGSREARRVGLTDGRDQRSAVWSVWSGNHRWRQQRQSIPASLIALSHRHACFGFDA